MKPDYHELSRQANAEMRLESAIEHYWQEVYPDLGITEIQEDVFTMIENVDAAFNTGRS